MRMLSAERLIIDAGLFGFSAEEIADNIDAAIRLRLVAVVRTGGLGRPLSQHVFSKDTGLIARVDFLFEGGLVVEVPDIRRTRAGVDCSPTPNATQN